MREAKVCGEGVEGDGEKEVFHVYFAFMLTGVEDDGSDRSPRCKRLIPHFSPLPTTFIPLPGEERLLHAPTARRGRWSPDCW